jgi:predicted DNA-binding protein (MmcQ/YjbR family)
VNALDRLRKICLALPEAEEKISWGHPAFHIRKKTFATFEPKGGRTMIYVRIDPMDAGIFAGDSRFVVSSYGRTMYLALWADGKIDWKLVKPLVEQSYRMVAPKRAILRRP